MYETDDNDGPEPLENLSLYLTQYRAWGIDITLEDVVDDFGITEEEARTALTSLAGEEEDHG